MAEREARPGMVARQRLEHRWIKPDGPRAPRPLLLIHGAWHGAWCWEAAMHDLAAQGFEVHALSLRGHGESAPTRGFQLCGIDAYLKDIQAVLATIEPTPVVVAHSLGGFLMQHYLAQQSLPGLVLLSTMPHTGPWNFLWRWARRHPRAALLCLVTLNTRHLVGTPFLAREAFFSPQLAPELVAAHTRRLRPEPLRVSIEVLLRRPRPRPGGTPILVVAGVADQVFTLDEQRWVAQAYGAPFVAVPEAPHDSMLDPSWLEVRDVITQTIRTWLGVCAPIDLKAANAL